MNASAITTLAADKRGGGRGCGATACIQRTPLERLLTTHVERVGWEQMAREVRIACFTSDPSISSSLKFLRKTPWARAKVEALYLRRCVAQGGSQSSPTPAAPPEP